MRHLDAVRRAGLILVLLSPAVCSSAAQSPQPLVRLKGAQFAGGAKDRYGQMQYGEGRVNYVYAKPTGALSTMQASFALDATPQGPLSVHLCARNNDLGGPCAIAVQLNGQLLFTGPNPFSSDAFEWRAFDVPEGALIAGDNELVISNIEKEGSVGMPPWFMVAHCIIGAPDVSLNTLPSIETQFQVRLPAELQPMPTPLAEGREPGFTLRGTKGWLWTADQYMAELQAMTDYQMNFLLVCYGSMWNIEKYPEWPERNSWWLPLPEKKREAYLELLRACQAKGVELCLSMNPNLSSSRILDYDSAEDVDALWRHYEWFQSHGMKWFCVSLDDISQGVDAAGQARLTNELLKRLREQDPEAQLVLCPTVYWGNGSGQSSTYGDYASYLETLGETLDQDVFLFWTGDAVVTPRITSRAARAYRDLCKHRLIIWDNYPVNDGSATLHLGPVTGRDPGLADICYGYMSNPMHSESEINRIPLMTCMDYAYNPWDYDPSRSIGQAIWHVAKGLQQRLVLKDLVELFPGMLLHRRGTGFNPVMDEFTGILGTPHSRYHATLYLEHVTDVARRLDEHFPDRFQSARDTLHGTLAKMVMGHRGEYGP